MAQEILNNPNTQAKEVKEVRAFAREIHVSPRKARLVANLVKKMPVGEATLQLIAMNKRASDPIKKLLDSAVANANHNFKIEADRLFIKNLTVDGGRVFLRYEPRAQGRALPVRKRTSRLSLILGVLEKPVKTKSKPKLLTKNKEKEKENEPMVTPAAETAVEPIRKSRFSFFRRKDKSGGTSQVPPKADPKGRHYTSFDRRGGT